MMRVVRWLGLVLLLGTGWTQEFTSEQKTEVLNKVNEVLHDTAFVPGVDFDQWPKFFDSHREAIEAATDRRSFLVQLNRTLREFGTSHIGVTVAKPRPKEGGSVRWNDLSADRSFGLPFAALEGNAEEVGWISLFLDRPMRGIHGYPSIAFPPSELLAQEAPPQVPDTPSMQTLSWPDEHTALLRLRTFSDGYKRSEVEKLMNDAAKADALIIDLRGNPGGSVVNLQHFMSLLLPPKTVIGTMVSRRTAAAYKRVNKTETAPDGLEIAKWTDSKFRTAKLNQEPFKGKIAVLISRGSASASEICAAALHEISKAPLIGGNSAGAVLVSRVISLPDGLEMKVPTADFYTPSYRRLEKNPLEPDAPIPPRDTEGCVAKALELLKVSHS